MKTFLSAFFSVIVVAVALAQPPHAARPAHGKPDSEHREKIESLKISFLTERLDLSPDEAQKFWPVYNQYKDALKSLRQEKQNLPARDENMDALSEKEILELVDRKILYDQKNLDIKKKYHEEFKKVLPLKKVVLLYKSEEEFKEELLKQTQKGNAPHNK